MYINSNMGGAFGDVHILYNINKRLSARMHSKIESVPIKHPPSPTLPYTSPWAPPAALL